LYSFRLSRLAALSIHCYCFISVIYLSYNLYMVNFYLCYNTTINSIKTWYNYNKRI